MADDSLDQYWTRPPVAQALVDWADIKPGARILEPSAGAGDIVRCIPERAARLVAIEMDRRAWAKWDPELLARPALERVEGDFLRYRAPSDAFDLAIMNPPYGWQGSGKARKAQDRLHVQHALRMAPDVIALVRANFLWGKDRFRYVIAYAKIMRVAIMVNRPSFYGPALREDQDSARHDFCVVHLRRRGSSDPDHNQAPVKLEFWTNDWKVSV